MKVYNRETKKIEEEMEFGGAAIDFLYRNPLGRLLLKIVNIPFSSRLTSLYYKSALSVNKTKAFIEKFGIKDSYRNYRSFNDFFIREAPFEKCADDEFPAVADSRLLIKDVGDNFRVKRSVYNVNSLTGGKFSSSSFKGCKALIFRLSMQDIHRHIYPDRGYKVLSYRIKGLLNSVRPVSEEFRVFHTNSRKVTLYRCQSLGKVLETEIGALLVGRIVTHKRKHFEKFDERGYFEFGGSTIVLLVDSSKVKFDEDIISNSENNIETIVKRGERIGVFI